MRPSTGLDAWADSFLRIYPARKGRCPHVRLLEFSAIIASEKDLKVKAVVVRSRGGKSATMVAATRPAAPVLALTTDPAVCRRLNLLWGVVPVVIEPMEFDNPRPVARRLVQQMGLAQAGECILLVAGFGKNEPTVTVLSV